MSSDATAADVLAGRAAWAVEARDCLEGLRAMPEGCVQCVCTSPPYYALRDYGDEGQDWPEVTYTPMPGLPPLTVPAMKAPLGLEPTVEAYTAHLVLIFREVFRVLRDDGLCLLNLGDSYADASRSHETRRKDTQGVARPCVALNCERCGNLFSGNVGRRFCSAACGGTDNSRRRDRTGIKAKDLLMVPPRVALALQAEGWYIRQIINWQKVSPMPSSARDRPTSATEEIYLLAKRASYFYDIDACRVPSSPVTLDRDRYSRITATHAEEQYAARHDHETPSNPSGRNLWNWWDLLGDDPDEDAAKLPWRLGPEPNPEKHYAQYPSEIPRRAIKLGTSAHGCCPECGSPWGRVVEREAMHDSRPQPSERVRPAHGWGGLNETGSHTRRGTAVVTTGWEPACGCPDADPLPCVVLDPFCGSGTTGVVARELGRRFVGFEVNAEYATICRRRIGGVAPMFDETPQPAAAPDAPAEPGLFGGRP